MQNQDLTQLGAKIADYLSRDINIDNYCQMRFNSSLNVFVGPTEAEMPGEELCPYLFLHDISKTEGPSLSTATYEAVISVGIYTEDGPAMAGAVQINSGQQYCSELMTLIQKSLYNYKNDQSCLPPNRVESYLPLPPYASQYHWEGFLVVSWEIELYMGAEINF